MRRASNSGLSHQETVHARSVLTDEWSATPTNKSCSGTLSESAGVESLSSAGPISEADLIRSRRTRTCSEKGTSVHYQGFGTRCLIFCPSVRHALPLFPETPTPLGPRLEWECLFPPLIRHQRLAINYVSVSFP